MCKNQRLIISTVLFVALVAFAFVALVFAIVANYLQYLRIVQSLELRRETYGALYSNQLESNASIMVLNAYHGHNENCCDGILQLYSWWFRNWSYPIAAGIEEEIACCKVPCNKITAPLVRKKIVALRLDVSTKHDSVTRGSLSGIIYAYL